MPGLAPGIFILRKRFQGRLKIRALETRAQQNKSASKPED
jgi:hypothetical protein